MYSGQIESSRPALLPVDRGQDRPLRRPRRAPDLPGARRARRRHGLSQRHLHLAAGGGAAGDPARRSPAWSRSGWSGRAMPSNTTTSIRASSIPRWRPGGCRACSWPGRSTAPPATRRRRRRGWSPASMRPRRAGGAEPIVFDRADAYIGVMIDDLVTRGRHRAVPDVHLARRIPADAARRQCRPAPDRQGYRARLCRAGPVDPSRRQDGGAECREGAGEVVELTPNEAGRHGLSLNRDGQRRSAFELLAYPEVGWSEVRGIWPELSAIDPAIAVHLEIDAKYDVYLKRQTADVDAFRRDEGLMPAPISTTGWCQGCPTRPVRSSKPRVRDRRAGRTDRRR